MPPIQGCDDLPSLSDFCDTALHQKIPQPVLAHAKTVHRLHRLQFDGCLGAQRLVPMFYLPETVRN